MSDDTETGPGDVLLTRAMRGFVQIARAALEQAIWSAVESPRQDGHLMQAHWHVCRLFDELEARRPKTDAHPSHGDVGGLGVATSDEEMTA